MATNILKIGILSRSEYRERTIAIAKGEYTPKKDDPKIWFESLQKRKGVRSCIITNYIQSSTPSLACSLLYN